jgi:hypothetical protein
VLYGTGSSPLATYQNANIALGLFVVGLALTALWKRRDLYWVYQWIVRYPDHGAVYVLIQLFGPALAIVGGVALVIAQLIGP